MLHFDDYLAGAFVFTADHRIYVLLSQNFQAGGSSYSSAYSSRGMGGSGYMGSGGSGSYY